MENLINTADTIAGSLRKMDDESDEQFKERLQAEVNKQQALAPAKPATALCICKNGQVIARQGEAEPRNTIFIPMNLNGDPRLFIKNGELVRPFVTFEFKLRRTLDISGIAVSLYHEEGMAEFDPTDMVPVAVRSLDKDFDELNAR